jgi:hypothetical protein
VITSKEDMDLVTIRRGHQSQTNTSGRGHTIFRYYDIMPVNNTALNATLRIHYFNSELNNLDENALTKWASADNQHWINLGFTLRNTMSNFVEHEGINSFARFTLTEPNNPLPVRWGSFNTQCISGQTKISWKTLQEQNTSVFTIRRSTDGTNWTNIGNIAAAGNSQTPISYSFTDPSNGKTYYQVFLEDLDESRSFSPVIASECSAPAQIKVYPVPAKNNCWVSIQSERNHTVSLSLYDGQGALLKQQSVDVMTGNNLYEIQLAKYARGVYSLVIRWDDGNVKVMKVEKD